MIPAPFVFNARLVTVQDGDTLNVTVSRGMYDYTGSTEKPIPVRVVGIAALELADPGGTEARDNLRALIPPGTMLVLATVKPDKYAPRWLAKVTYLDTTGLEQDLGSVLIAAGWALPWNGRGVQPKPVWPRVLP